MLRWSKSIRLAATIAALATVTIGCGEGVVDDGSDTVYFAPLERDQLRVETVPAPEAPSEEDLARVKPVIEGFSKNASVLFARGDIQRRLPQIEQVFITSGHYLDLLGIYQNVIETQGISSRATPRLVRHYLRLGQRHLARQLLDQMIEGRSDEALTWFLNGAYWLPKLQESEEAGARVVASWQRVLDLDPNFKGFEQAGVPELREQLAVLRQRVPKQAIDKAIAEIDDTGASPAKEAEEAEEAQEAEATDPQEPGDDNAELAEAAETAESTESTESTEEVEELDEAPVAEAEPLIEAKPTRPEAVAVTVARAEMAFSEGDADRAEKLFKEALEREPTHVGARLGLIRNGWSDQARRNDLATSLRELAERDDLTPRQQYEIGYFAFSKMQDRRLAAKLWKEAKKRDPELAKTVGLDRLIERASR